MYLSPTGLLNTPIAYANYQLGNSRHYHARSASLAFHVSILTKIITMLFKL